MDKKEEVALKAKEYFGTTRDFREVGYITILGDMLDFSGKRDGGSSGRRSMDHREINEIYDYLGSAGKVQSFEEFIDDGNIRVSNDNLEVVCVPNDAQAKVLQRWLTYYEGNVNLDCFHAAKDERPFFSATFSNVRFVDFYIAIKKVFESQTEKIEGKDE